MAEKWKLEKENSKKQIFFIFFFPVKYFEHCSFKILKEAKMNTCIKLIPVLLEPKLTMAFYFCMLSLKLKKEQNVILY